MKKTKTTHASRLATSLASPVTSLLLVALLGASAMNQPASAADATFTTANGTWSTSATNWSGVSGTPWDSTNGSGNTAIFNSASTATVTGGSNVHVNKITFNANTSLLYTSPPEAVITLAGANATIDAAAGTSSTIKTVLAGTNGLIKTGSGTVVLEPGDGWWSNTFSGPITINGGELTSIRATSLGNGAGAITINSGGILNVDWNTVTRTGLITVDAGTLRTQGGSPQLINNGAGFVFQNGAAITTSLGGSGGLTVNGARSFLYSTNSYTGGTVINAGGDLALLYGAALPTDTALSLSGTLLVNNKSHTVGGLSGASTGLLYGDTNYTFTVNKVSGTDSYGGTIQNIGTFIKDGAGTLSLTHANNNTLFPSALTVNNGVLELGGAGRFNAGSYSGAISLSNASSTLRIATSANQTLSGAISGNGSLTKSGNGNLTLSGNNSFSGNTTISGGSVIASSANALGDASGSITVSGNTSKLFVNANTTRNGTVTIDGGELGTNNSSTLTNNGGGFVLSGSTAASAVSMAGSGGLTSSATDARLWSANTYTGNTTVTSGTLMLAGSGSIPTASALSIAAGASVNLTGFFAPENVNRTIGGLSGNGTLYGANGTVTVNKTTGTDTFAGAITGGQGLIKDGTGDLALAGSNTYTGNTTVSAGRLAVAHNNALGSTASGTTVASGAQLFLNGVTVGNETITISGTGLASGTSTAGAIRSANGTSNTLQGKINLAADARIFSGTSTSLTVDVASGDAINLGAFNLNIDGAGTHTVNDAIVGTGGLVKSGSGITTLSAVNSYSGATDIQAGRVVLSGAGRLGSGAISVANASTGTLEFAVTGTNTMSNNISGNGSLLSSSGETRFTGAVTSTGGLTINSNSAVRIGNGGTTGSYSGNTVLGNSAAQLIFDRSDSYAHAGSISGNGSVVIAGAGTTTLSGTNTYTGLTTVSSGGLTVNGSVAGAMTVDAGATLGGSGTIGGATTVNGSLNPGNSPGLLTFSNSLTLGSNATTTMEITGANSSGTRGSTYDAINVGGALTYGGTLSLNFDTPFTQQGIYAFNLFDFAGSPSGSFSTMSLAGIYSGSFTNNSGIWGLTQGDNSWSFNQGDGVLTFTVVPEPNAAMMVGSLMLMSLLRRRRD